MRFRISFFVAALAVHACAYGGACVQVLRSDGHSTAGLTVHGPLGNVIGEVDAFGRFCPSAPGDTVVFSGMDIRSRRIAWDEAVAAGKIDLEVLPPVTELTGVAIVPWPAPRDRQALAAVSTMDSLSLHRTEQASLRNALAWVPGVQIDERGHGGSARLSIRGSLLRSPYGVRGVKVYWGPFALTLADGSTPLELLDPELIGSMDVVRSVGGPAYGTAPSGLLLAEPPARKEEGISAHLAAVGGSDGYFKLSAGTQVHQANGDQLSVGILRMGNDGYRTLESAKRNQAFITHYWQMPEGSVRVYLTAQKAAWDLPGSLDSLTAAQDPRAARPYSQLINAHIAKSQFFAGLAAERRLWKGILLRTSMQAQAIDKVNPYGTSPAFSGYKDEELRAGGARLSLGSTIRHGTWAFVWELGMETLLEKDHLNEREFADGMPADVRTDAESRVGNLNAFLTTRTRIGSRTTLFADLGSERTVFHQNDLLRMEDISDRPSAKLYPLLGIERELATGISVQMRYAESISRPTIWEVLGSSGIPNTELAPEEVSEAEAGFDVNKGHLGASITGYLRRTEGMILSRMVNNGTEEEFINAGDARQQGVEWSFTGTHGLPGQHRLEISLVGAWQHHLLHLPDADPVDVPGVPRWTGGIRARLITRWGTTTEAGYLANSAIPASSTNADRIAGHGTLQARIEQPVRWRGTEVRAFLLVENLLDARYTDFIQLDDPGRRYYNPAPGRGIFGGLAFVFGHDLEAD